MINLSLNKQLDIIVPNKNRALALILEQASPKEREVLSKERDLGSIINALLKESSKNSDKTLLDLAKNNPTLKDLGNISTTLKELLNGLKSEKNPLETTLKNFLLDMKDISEATLKDKFQNSGIFLESKLKNAQNPQVELKSLLVQLEKSISKSDLPLSESLNQKIKDLLSFTIVKEASNDALLQPTKDDPASLKQLAKDVETLVGKLSQSIKMETDKPFAKELASLNSKIATFSDAEKLIPQNEVKEILSKDLKAVLLKVSEELSSSPQTNKGELLKQVDKLLLQIDYYQLTSHLSNSSSLYLPFSWDSLEEGSINLKKDKDDKFYCDIDLKLQEYGEVKLKLALYEQNQININIYASSNDFKEIIKENIPHLRSLLIEAQITPRELRIFDAIKKPSPYESAYRDIDLGFEVKV